MAVGRRGVTTDYTRLAEYRRWWREFPGVVEQASGLIVAPYAVDAAERRLGSSVGAMFDQAGRKHGNQRLTEFRDTVFRVYHDTALQSAGLHPAARKVARVSGTGDRTEAGLRTGLVTLRTLATLDSVVWRSGLARVAPGIERIDVEPVCDPRCLLHAAATGELIEQLATDDPEPVFEALNRTDGGWDAAARLAGATDQQVPAVAAAMRQRYAAVDDIDLASRRIEAGRTWLSRHRSRNQVTKLGDAPRRAQGIGRRAIEAGRGALARLEAQPEPVPAPAPPQQVLDPRAGLSEFGSITPPQGGADGGTAAAYGQGRDDVDRGR
jgi:hypothetical protein